MSHRYIQLNRDEFDLFLKSKGFIIEAESKCLGREIVYVHQHLINKNLWVKVYSSFSAGEEVARSVGSDAIRIVSIYNDGSKSFGIFKATRTYRTGSQQLVHERVLERIRLAYSKLNEWNKRNK